MTFDQIETKWGLHLASENCPPVLGLCALSEEESSCIRRCADLYFSQSARPKWRNLFDLLEQYPASTSVWLARKAGEAYDSGAFWDRFCELIGVDLPWGQRARLAEKFRHACRKVMSGWTAPGELGNHKFVAEFLHQAGLPLDRCDRFAEQVRRVERLYGLPDPESQNAGSQLRESLLESLEGANLPTVKQALRGPAGARICEVALAVVFKTESTDVNPRLAVELERVFGQTATASLRRSLHQPYLRLGGDLTSLEVVGPRQDSSLISAKGISWVLNGRRTPTPRTSEFVAVVTDLPRVLVETEGMIGGSAVPRTFVLRLRDRTEPFLLFDGETLRERRGVGPIPSGRYWLLHESEDTVAGAEETYDWSDGRSLSGFHLQPGGRTVLESSSGRCWSFEAAYEPCFDSLRSTIGGGSGTAIYGDCSAVPSVWIPSAEADQDMLPQWSVSIFGAGPEIQCSITATGHETGGMAGCQIACGAQIESLPPAMYRIEMRLRRAGRNRVEARTGYWLWRGLRSYDRRTFELNGRPTNLLSGGCIGFQLGEDSITHRSDHRREHKLTFEIDGVPTEFTWQQPGVFLETVDRRPGQRAAVTAQALGTPFSASSDSYRWLRIWLSGYKGWQILVADRVCYNAAREDLREFVDLSLANLAVAFPQGGEVRLRTGGWDQIVAHFTSPLCPVDVERRQDGEGIELKFRFAESVGWVRFAAWNIDTAQEELSGGQALDAGGCELRIEGLPSATCFRATLGEAQCGDLVGFCIPRQGWPQGSWIIELQIRRDEQSEWQEVLVRGKEYAPVFLRTGGFGLTERSRLLAAAGGFPAPEAEILGVDNSDEVLRLLEDLLPLRRRTFASISAGELGWVKPAVRNLSRAADRFARRPEAEAFRKTLLDLACLDSASDVFVHLPGLLALPSQDYAELPGGEPLNDALRLCARLGRADSIVGLVRDGEPILDLSVVANFGNFPRLATSSETSGTEDLCCFATERYWQEIVGSLNVSRLCMDWSGGTALGRDHAAWAVAQVSKRYESSDSDLASANALLARASSFKEWLFQNLGKEVIATPGAAATPWLRVDAPESDFVERVPRFASIFALAARASAAGLLEWEAVLGWLEETAGQSRTEKGIAALVGVAPELFGHQLLYWELLVRTRPH